MEVLNADLEEEGFSFIWTIQNYSLCFRNNKDISYESPKFELDESCNEKWSIVLHPKRYFHHDNIGFALHRLTAGKYRKLNFEFLIRDANGSFIKSGKSSAKFLVTYDLQHLECAPLNLILNKEVLEKCSISDSLIIKCRIWQLGTEVLKTRLCYARTIISAETIRYGCKLEGFEEFEKGTRIEKSVIILSEFPFVTMDLSTTEKTYAENKIEIKIKPIIPNTKFYCTCEISLIDADGKIAHSVRDEYNFENSLLKQAWTFPFIRLSKVLRNKELYLPNGVLNLSCEFIVSSGVKYNEIERTESGIGKSLLLQSSDQTTDSDMAESLRDNLQRFYEDEKFTDLTIRTPSKKFRVHKPILCARSEVFSAMFERDMKENQTGIVVIEDIDDDTISKMLLFLYTDTIGEDLEFEMASSLYFAADKYKIVALKRKCANFLKDNFTVTNVCDVLVLADMHQDQELKSAAQEFIFEHSGEIIKSEEWTKLMQNNIQIASVTMRLFIQNLNI